MTQLSQHFSLAELTVTNTGLPNQPDSMVLSNLSITAQKMEAVRALLGHPITVESGYRSPAVNKAVRGVSTSAHCQGYAVDFVCPEFGTVREIALKIISAGIVFDQLILEGANDGQGGWVHISFARPYRHQELTAHFVPGQKTTYTAGIA